MSDLLTTAVISFREFLEAFLVLGIFLGVSKNLHLRKEKEIWLAAGTGVILSFIFATGAYLLDARVHYLLTEKNADLIESYLLIFSGLFMAYVVLSLHKSLAGHKKRMMESANEKLAQNIFDISLFLTIVLMVTREGVEIALFTAGTSMFSVFSQNMLGLLLGFILSAIFGGLVFLAYVKIPVGTVFKVTEFVIILVGAALLQIGVSKWIASVFGFKLSTVLPLPMPFLPGEESSVGHLIQSLLGIDRYFSGGRLLISALYVAGVYLLLKRRPRQDLVAERA